MLGIDVNDFLKGSDKGRSFSEQVAIQKFLGSYGTGLSLADADLERAIAQHHEALLAQDYSRFRSLVLEFECFPVLCSTGHMPSDDWSGHAVQNLNDPALQADWITAVSFRSQGRAWIVFTWLKRASVIETFITSLLERRSSNISDALIKYFFSISENLVVDQDWWSRLSNAERDSLNFRVIDGLPIGGGLNILAPRRGEPVMPELALLTTRYV